MVVILVFRRREGRGLEWRTWCSVRGESGRSASFALVDDFDSIETGEKVRRLERGFNNAALRYGASLDSGTAPIRSLAFK